jgi:hypothetical protein
MTSASGIADLHRHPESQRAWGYLPPELRLKCHLTAALQTCTLPSVPTRKEPRYHSRNNDHERRQARSSIVALPVSLRSPPAQTVLCPGTPPRRAMEVK